MAKINFYTSRLGDIRCKMLIEHLPGVNEFCCAAEQLLYEKKKLTRNSIYKELRYLYNNGLPYEFEVSKSTTSAVLKLFPELKED